MTGVDWHAIRRRCRDDLPPSILDTIARRILTSSSIHSVNCSGGKSSDLAGAHTPSTAARRRPADQAMTATAKCPVCDDTGWVCEAHPDPPWGFFSDRADACQCGGAGMPCTACNPSDAEQPPDMSRTGLIVEDSDCQEG
jgi:hypothetical protein